MMSNTKKQDGAVLVGKIKGGFAPYPGRALSGYLVTTVSVPRLSGTKDKLIVAIPSSMIDREKDYMDQKVYVAGVLRTENIREKGMKNGKSHLYIYIRADEFSVLEGWEDSQNAVDIEGYLCRKPDFRITKSGIHITDLWVAVNGDERMSSYVPVICWNYTADAAKDLEVGDFVSLSGRLQSRTYPKEIDGVKVDKTAYELSVGKMAYKKHSVVLALSRERKAHLLAYYGGDMDAIAKDVEKYGADALNAGFDIFDWGGTGVLGIRRVCEAIGSDADAVGLAEAAGYKFIPEGEIPPELLLEGNYWIDTEENRRKIRELFPDAERAVS